MSTIGPLPAGITRAGEGIEGTVWSVLGHTYWYKANSDSAFSFETFDPPGSFVPAHIHPTQDEFIYVLEGTFDLYLDGQWLKATKGDLVCMPMGKPHAYYNKTDTPNRAIFWVSPGRRLKELFDRLHNLSDIAEVVRHSHECEVDFLPPGAVEGA